VCLFQPKPLEPLGVGCLWQDLSTCDVIFLADRRLEVCLLLEKDQSATETARKTASLSIDIVGRQGSCNQCKSTDQQHQHDHSVEKRGGSKIDVHVRDYAGKNE
jgi:hypothetical protein